MTENIFLNWAAMAVSIINVILLLWLGLTVLLNAKQRVFGVWLASGGLLLGALFFISHTAILGYGREVWATGLNWWWRVGWLPLLVLPLTWYLVTLWHIGQWRQDSLWPRRRGWTILLLALCATLMVWLLTANPLPSFAQITWLNLSATPQVGGIPLFLIIFPGYIILCIVPATVELLRARHIPHIRTDPGRQRAHPWLIGTSLGLVGVTLLVSGIIGWVAWLARQPGTAPDFEALGTIAAWADLVIAALIAVATLLLGQAIISFEVLTHQTLPRFEFQRLWRNAIILAVGYGLVVGLGLVLTVRPIYILLLSTGLMTIFFAMSGWRGHTLREQYLSRLRPFLSSQKLYDHLLAASPAEVDINTPFQALCQDVLRTEFAQLVPLGPLAPLVSRLSLPPGHAQVSLPPEIVAQCQSPEVLYVPVRGLAPVQWVVPLWSERGVIGLFLLGKKRSGDLFTQEELEIARATGERLIDTCASAEISRRLMALQRQRWVESRVIDRQTRRILHDDVLPNLHTVLLSLGNQPAHAQLAQTLTETHQQISQLLRQMPSGRTPNLDQRGLFGALHQLMTGEFAGWFDAVTWQLDPVAEAFASKLPPVSADVLYHALREVIRNAAKHGRDSDAQHPLTLCIRAGYTEHLAISIEDNGIGPARTSTTDNGGHGLALHSTMLAIIGGQLNLESVPGSLTRVTITL